MIFSQAVAAVDPVTGLIEYVIANGEKATVGVMALLLAGIVYLMLRNSREDKKLTSDSDVSQSQERKSFIELIGEISKTNAQTAQSQQQTAIAQNALVLGLDKFKTEVNLSMQKLTLELVNNTETTSSIVGLVEKSLDDVITRDRKKFLDYLESLLPRPAAVVSLDIDGNILFASQNFTNLTGLSLQKLKEVLVSNVGETLVDERGTVISSLLNPFLTAKTLKQTIHQIIGINNKAHAEWVWLLCRADPMFDREDPTKVDRILMTFTDAGASVPIDQILNGQAT